MRILLINTRHYLGGGDSAYSFALADLLRSKGHQVGFFAMMSSQNVPDPDDDLFVSHIDYRQMQRTENPVTATRVLMRSVYSAEARRKIARLLDRGRPDIMHIQNIHGHITPSICFEAKRRNIPVVWTLHDYKLICPNSHFLIDRTAQICEACRGAQFWHAAATRCKKDSMAASTMATIEAYGHQLMGVRSMVDAFLCPSAFLREKFLLNGYEEKTLHHLPLFLPAGAFRNIGHDDGYILFLGALVQHKGIGQLIEAGRKCPTVEVLLAGRVEEPLLSELPGLLPPNIRYLGFQTGSALTALQAGARALIMPSLSYENQPLSILEAFALGKPVIASDLGGMRELVGRDERGLLVARCDVDGLARGMTWMVEHPDGARRMGDAAFHYVQEMHGPEKHYRALMSIYQDLP